MSISKRLYTARQLGESAESREWRGGFRARWDYITERDLTRSADEPTPEPRFDSKRLESTTAEEPERPVQQLLF